jgi:hypothetical protein
VTDILTLDEARTHLGQVATERDDDIAGTYIPAVTAVVEDVVGPVVARSLTHTADGGEAGVLLPVRPVSVESVVENGATLTAEDYMVSLSSGIVWRGTGTSSTAWYAARGAVVVTYTAGAYADVYAVPAHIKLAARLILAQLWQSDQQAYRPEFGGPDTSMETTPSGFAIPRRAMALLNSGAGDRMPGFA